VGDVQRWSGLAGRLHPRAAVPQDAMISGETDMEYLTTEASAIFAMILRPVIWALAIAICVASIVLTIRLRTLYVGVDTHGNKSIIIHTVPALQEEK